MNPDGNKELFRKIVNKADAIYLLMHKTHREVDSKTLSNKFDEYIERLNKCIKEIELVYDNNVLDLEEEFQRFTREYMDTLKRFVNNEKRYRDKYLIYRIARDAALPDVDEDIYFEDDEIIECFGFGKFSKENFIETGRKLINSADDNKLEDLQKTNYINNINGEILNLQIQQGTIDSFQEQTVNPKVDYKKIDEMIMQIKKYDELLDSEFGIQATEFRRRLGELEKLVYEKENPDRIKNILADIKNLAIGTGGSLIASGIVGMIGSL